MGFDKALAGAEVWVTVVRRRFNCAEADWQIGLPT